MMDYIFYRIYNYYRIKKDEPFASAISFIIVVYASILLFVVNLINYFFNGIFSKESEFFNLIQLKWLFGGFCFFLIVFNFFRYGNRKRRDRIFSRFKGLKMNQNIRTWQIFILPILIAVFSITLMVLLK
jgi:hypothetical protein